ncbi:MAG: phospholipase D family protein [Candidatus Hydrogenedentes bacterium]|nr:phospholipase D family protein [Candidatus Hydrogenedentota bacterium]
MTLSAVIYTCLVASTVAASGLDSTPAYDSPLFSFAQQITQASLGQNDETQDNRVAIIDDGYRALLLRVHLIRNAQRSIDIQTFILENDECGRLMMYELIQAAKRGVRVRLLVDHFMSDRDGKWVAFLATAHPNFLLKYYRPPANLIDPPKVVEVTTALLSFRNTNQRMHNKLMIFDDCIAITGGRNIDNHYYNHSTSYNFLDRDAVVIGPVLPSMAHSFREYWKFWRSVPSAELLDVAAIIKSNSFDRLESKDDFRFNGCFEELDSQANDAGLIQEHFVSTFMKADKLEFMADAPGKKSGFWIWSGGKFTWRIRRIMSSTEDNLVIQSPYLILNNRARRNFRKLHRRRPAVRVVISTNSFGATDNTVAYSANYRLRPSYIQNCGFHIYELKPFPDDLHALLPNYADLEQRAQQEGTRHKPFVSVHAKSFVCDDKTVFVGSYNIDPRSDHLDTEAGVLIKDPRIAKVVKDAILKRTGPGSSWVIAKKKFPLSDVNYLIEGISGLSPIDIWPLRNTSSFELLPGKEPLPPDDKDFYTHYRDVGGFPGAQGLTTKEITTHLYRIIGGLATPIM